MWSRKVSTIGAPTINRNVESIGVRIHNNKKLTKEKAMRTVKTVAISGSQRQIEQLLSVVATLFNSPVNIQRNERPLVVIESDIEQVVRSRIRDAQLQQSLAA